jgi:hypothetical protein
MPQTFEGFNFDREQNVNKSAKDSFAELSKRAPAAPIHDKQALGGWFQQYIQGGMNDRGHKVSSVEGDKFNYGNHEGNFTVDYGRGAGAANGSLAWQAEASDDATRQRYPGAAPSPVAQRQGNPIGRASDQSDLRAMLLASLGQQQQQPVDPQALLLQQLR